MGLTDPSRHEHLAVRCLYYCTGFPPQVSHRKKVSESSVHVLIRLPPRYSWYVRVSIW